MSQNATEGVPYRKRVANVRNKGLTKIEIVVIVVVCGVALAILIPFLLRQRMLQRRQWCEKRQIDVSQAIFAFEDSAKRFPGFRNLQAETAGGERIATGWVFPVLPYLGRKTEQAEPGPYGEVFDAYGPQGPAETRGKTPEVFLTELVCPDHRPATEADKMNWLGWVVNSGLPDVANQQDLPPDWPANGVFLDHFSRPPAADYQVSLAYISEHDGAEHTLLLSENVDAGRWTDAEEPRVGFVWAANLVNGEPSPQGVLFRLNRRRGEGDGTMQFARPASYHLGGVNVVFCDGSTRFLSDGIDYVLFCRLMTPDGAGAKQAGTQERVPAAYATE